MDLKRYAESQDSHQLPVPLFLDIAIQLADALDAIHHAQVIHKDLHPGNIVLNPDTGRVQIIDFGLASLLTREQPAIIEPDKLEGILSYISPEQTGRMNRAIDYRSDIYTLGVTFYKLLTGDLPFEADDALGIVYAHMATQQQSASTKRPALPAAISSIIDKMMMKNAEDRYQSAFGLKHDLLHCQRSIVKDGTVNDFLLATNDVSSRFCIPQTLYGRNEELGLLLESFDKAKQGRPQLLTVCGYSGIGKSALIHEVYKPIAASNGVFISGKFDQFQQNTPYSAIKAALTNWLKQELRLPEDQLLSLRKRLGEALGNNVRVLIEFLPELELLFGKHEAPLLLGAQETLARFVLVFQAFIKTITEDKPWVIFIDDIQWADRGTLHLIPELLSEPGCRLLILLAYRDNEVDSQHPAQSMLNKVAARKFEAQHIKLKPLKKGQLRLLIMDTFQRTQADVQELADLVVSKTGGNPFFSIEFLKALDRKGLVTFDISEHYWTWDLETIKLESITDNVVELMLERMSELPIKTQKLLQKAACVGTRFDLETLAVASDLPMEEVAESLWLALKEGLLVQEGGDWFLAVIGGFQQTLQGEYGESVLVPQKLLSQYYSLRSHETAIHSFIPSCKFLHDRMLQAAYESLGEEERVDTHLSIGWRLYKTYSDDEKEERVFELVEQLNHGISLISDQLEIENLIELNVLAAEKAKLSSVWLAADQYSSLALILLGDNAWAESYDKCFKLYKIKAEAAYLNGDLEASKQLYSQLVDNAIDPLDKVELLAYLLVQAIGRSDYALGLEMGRQALSILGIDIPDDLSSLKAIMLEQASQLRDALAKRPIKDFENWPECKDRSHHLTNYVLVNFGLAGFLMQRIEFASVCIQASLISATLHGRTDATPVTLTTYGMLLALRDEYGAAYEAGEKAKQWLESNPNCRDSASAWNGIGVSLAHLKGHVTESYYAYERGFEAGIETGELARAGVCLSAKSTIKAVAGFPIEELLTEYEEAKAFVEKKSLRVPFLPILENSWQSYLKHEYLLGDENFEATSLAIINGSSFKAFLMYCRFEYFFWDEADCETLVAHLFDAVASYGLFKSHFMMVDLYCLSNLAFIRAQREGFVGASHQAFKKLEKVSNELKHILQLRADLYSLNHEHKIALVEAEQLALDGAPFEQTAKRYKQAIKEAEENGFRQYAGLSNEFFGRYLIDIGFESLADVPIKRAHSWYKSWGNKAKIDRLLACYPELAISEKRDKTVPATFSNSSNVTLTQQFSTGLSATSSVRSGEALDFQSIIKSMQTLSGELDLHNLIESMMKVILENAGAHIGVLVVQSLKGPKIEAQVDLPNDQASYLMHIPLEKSVNVPQDIINLTLRLGETIWLENACADGEFKEDAYISKARSKSVLCLPIVYRKSQIGALYLENNLSTGVFTEQRMSVIKVLLTQAAISLENARLFNEVTGLNASLEEKVAQRTRDLDQANVELASANKELESFSYTVSHDLKSPLRMIKGFSDILLDDYASQLDEEAQRILAKVVAGAKSMEDLINGLLDLSRMQRKEVKRTDLNLSEIADTVVANLRDTYPLRVVDIYIQPDMNINGDARMMHSVVENLINNAWKYSSKTESAEIAFSSALVEDELGRTERVFKVKDNGAGFDMSHAGKLFSTFQRLHNKSDFDGTGVGLSTVKRIVEKHGGRVWADSEVGKGASFYFTIPEQ